MSSTASTVAKGNGTKDAKDADSSPDKTVEDMPRKVGFQGFDTTKLVSVLVCMCMLVCTQCVFVMSSLECLLCKSIVKSSIFSCHAPIIQDTNTHAHTHVAGTGIGIVR
jgi:hypothetical protein